MQAHVKINIQKELTEIQELKNTIGSTKTLLNDVGQFAVTRLNFHSPKAIQGTWAFIVSGNTVTIFNTKYDNKLLWRLELGTTAHWVEPVNAQALHWEENGEDFFSKGHMVSGIQPHLFLTRTEDEVTQYIRRRTKSSGTMRGRLTV